MQPKKGKRLFIVVGMVLLGLLASMNGFAQMDMDMPTLDPTTIPKFVNQLTIPDVWVPTIDPRDPATGKILLERYVLVSTSS